MFDRFIDIAGGWMSLMFVLIFIRMWRGVFDWRDFSVMALTAGSAAFWFLIALRRIFEWDESVSGVIIAMKLIGVTLVMAHVWTQPRVTKECE